MSDHREFAGVSAQILDEVRLYLEKYYEEPEEIFYGVCHDTDGADLEEDGYPGEALEAADEECISSEPVNEECFSVPCEESPREKRKKPGLFGAKKLGTARESAPDVSDEAFMGAASKVSGAANAMQMSASDMKPMAFVSMAAADSAPAFKPGRRDREILR